MCTCILPSLHAPLSTEEKEVLLLTPLLHPYTPSTSLGSNVCSAQIRLQENPPANDTLTRSKRQDTVFLQCFLCPRLSRPPFRPSVSRKLCLTLPLVTVPRMLFNDHLESSKELYDCTAESRNYETHTHSCPLVSHLTYRLTSLITKKYLQAKCTIQSKGNRCQFQCNINATSFILLCKEESIQNIKPLQDTTRTQQICPSLHCVLS